MPDPDLEANGDYEASMRPRHECLGCEEGPEGGRDIESGLQ